MPIIHPEYENNHPQSQTETLRMERKGRDSLKEITVRVQDNDLEKAMRILKKKIQNDGLFKRLKLKKNYEKPSEYRRRKQREALRRQRIAAARRNRYN
jgi:small subunit ribosomal protein S21